MKTALSAALLSTVLLAGCISNEDPYYKIKIVDQAAVAGCKFVGNISTSSRNYGFFNATASEARARNAKQSAYNLGANRVVLDEAIENGNTTINDGKAYSCQY